MSTLFCLLKFGKKEHLELLMNEGEIRFSPIQHFRHSQEEERSDDLEGAVRVVNEELLTIEIEHSTLGKRSFTPVPGSLRKLTYYDSRFIGCFSSYAVTDGLFDDKETHIVDERMLSLGDHVLVITEPKEFFHRIKQSFQDLKMQFGYKYVRYLDLDAKGEIEIDLFTKRPSFSHQSEHRILVVLEKEEPLYIRIGSIKDLCSITPTALLPASVWIKTVYTARR